jgi:hypothetical protein
MTAASLERMLSRWMKRETTTWDDEPRRFGGEDGLGLEKKKNQVNMMAHGMA